ncbi:SirB1 family protein [Roseococcus suduntuyensis]|uniref:Regulator of sirC expression with transglutaminase-like and TPR domain n=1 Tax=Roseococcus suduntuyensis TaxID=455361 RepID=A0A840A4P0_9PROT|nr:tetratricopeptide repeat protein [Roseococcus suduntuyensis]MBB3896938.1 regulator of sirC expression with transglutaminase-like and TPR domain [Roseococcus suduntuyensis]
MSGTPEEEARAALDAVGQLPDDEIDIGAAALQFARIDAPEADWRAAGGLLSDLARQAVENATADARADAGDVEARRAALARLLHSDWGFAGDAATYEDPRNANLIHVLERRRGLPVALGILWLHVADAAGWAAHGVDFPGHFLVALGSARGPALLDVFGGGVALGAPELRALIKAVEGPKAELRPGLVVPMTRRAVLLRLQNNIKLRRLRAGHLEAALTCTRDMLRIAPDHAALWREAGLMEQRLDRIGAALASLDRSLELEPEGEAASRIRGLVEELRNRLN